MPRKKIHECSLGEVRAILIAGTVIDLAIVVGSFFTGQTEWFLWPLRTFAIAWLFQLWLQCWIRIRELRGKTQIAAEPLGPDTAARQQR